MLVLYFAVRDYTTVQAHGDQVRVYTCMLSLHYIMQHGMALHCTAVHLHDIHCMLFAMLYRVSSMMQYVWISGSPF